MREGGRETDRQIDRQTDRDRDRQTDRHKQIKTGKNTDGHIPTPMIFNVC